MSRKFPSPNNPVHNAFKMFLKNAYDLYDEELPNWYDHANEYAADYDDLWRAFLAGISAARIIDNS